MTDIGRANGDHPWRAAPLGIEGSDRPRVALLTPHWESGSEEAWITRQVAGALAVVADVHVISPQGSVPRQRIDSVFAVHELGTPIERTAELRRDLLVEAISHGPGPADRPVPTEFAPLLDHHLLDRWSGADALLSELRPDRVVIAGHQQVGALDAVDRAIPDTPVTLLALGSDLDSLGFAHFHRLFERSEAILAVTETERAAIRHSHGSPDKVHRIGAPLAANSSALSEPSSWVGTTEYVLVLTDADSESEEEAVELARLVRLRFPDNPVAISYSDVFVVWHEGRWVPGWPVNRSSDLARLMAWARAVVDLRPGPLFARRCVDALLYGTPIIVPAGSRAREHAELGGGGLWFSTPAELTWCIDALFRPSDRQVFSQQGQAYAEERFGSTDRFIERVVSAVGLSAPDRTAAVRAPEGTPASA